jgi:hypothetical protein
MPLRGRPDVRIALWAFAFALWCLLWPAAIIATTWPMPGFMTLRGQGGLAELMRMLVPLPLWATALGVGVLAFAAMWALLLLRRRCDPDGDAIAAARWSFTSRSFNALVVLALASVALATVGSVDGLAAWIGRFDVGLARFFMAWWWTILVAIVAALALLLPFFLFNPETHVRDRLERWWRPFWPGMVAIVAALAFSVGSLAPAIVWDSDAISRAGGWQWPLTIVEEIVSSVVHLMLLGLWLSRSPARMSGAAVARSLRFDVLRRWVSLELFWLAVTAAAAVPLLSLSAFNIYVAPQFAEWERSGVVAISPAVRMLMASTEAHIPDGGLIIALSCALALYTLISKGRLLVRLGIGTPPAEAAGVLPGT